MKTFSLTFLLMLTVAITCFAQTNNYYKNPNGEILNESTYNQLKEEKLDAVKKVMKSVKIYEELDEDYRSTDSIVYTYKWHFTDRPKRTEAEVLKKKALIGTSYPINGAETLDGRVVELEDFQGKPTLVNLWFTSCAPCIEEMPVLSKMKREHSERFNFLAVTFESASKVNKLFERFEFDFEHIVNSKELTTKLGFNGFPVNLFLDKDGVIRRIEGNVPFVTNEEGQTEMSNGNEFLEFLEELL